MKLLAVYKKNDSYVVEALMTIKVWKIKMGRKKIRFQGQSDPENWTYFETGKTVKAYEQRILNRWIRDHQRFVE